MEVQQTQCPICAENLTPVAGKRRAPVDHCHKSNIIRGILCQRCNSGLGYFKDDTSLMFAAIEYLRAPPLEIEMVPPKKRKTEEELIIRKSQEEESRKRKAEEELVRDPSEIKQARVDDQV